MHQRLYCIIDTIAAEILGGIIRVNNDEVARRAFHEALADQNSPLKNARDYTLVRVATVDTETGIITPCERLTIATGADWADANNPNIEK